MRECTTVSTDTAPLKPNKRVNYTFGMVLGADEFQQEQEHNAWISRNSNLLLHGSGTVCGLRVTTHALPGDVEIRISPGYAISPRGKWIWVERELCARLGEWLLREGQTLSPPLTGRQTVYVNVCYDECETDLVPIAGQPCARDEDTRAASRILETARAEFSWTKPDPDVERQFREFGDILRRIEISDGVLSPDDSQLLIDLVRGLRLTTSPPLGPLPPGETINLSELTAVETIREALAVWTTEVCPTLRPGIDTGDCVLLSCVHFEVDNDGNLITSSVEVENCERPILVPDRLKQELFCLNTGSRGEPGPTGGTNLNFNAGEVTVGPFRTSLETRVSPALSHGLRRGAVFSAIVIDPMPLDVGADDPFRSGLNFSVTIYVDAENAERIRIAVTALTSANRFNIERVTVRWSGVSA